MGDVDERGAQAHDLFDSPETLLLEIGVTHRQDLVNQQDVRFQESGDGETEPHLHAEGEILDLAVDRILEPGEFNDLIESFAGKLPAHSQDGPVEKDVLPSCQVGMNPTGHAEERTEATFRVTRTGRLVGGTADDLEQRGLPGTVDADESQRPARLDADADIFQHPAIRLFASFGERTTCAQ